jgi:NAD+ kinase
VASVNANYPANSCLPHTEGDHIKVTASKFPFPTVCADKQSTDWFHAISRTLKWNERERQKSFVVVEEGPAKEKKRSSSKTRAAGGPEKIGAVQSPPAKPEEQAEDEDEEKFDIDDSSPEASAAAASASSTSSINTSPSDSKLPSPVFDTMPKRQKTDPALADAKAAFKDVVDPHVYSLGGTDSPDRFASRLPHPPSINPRHLSHTHEAQARSAAAPQYHHRLRGEEGARDDIHSPLSARTGTKSRIPKDRDVEGDSMRTPRPERKDHLRAGHHPHPNTHPTTARNHRRVGSLDSANSRRAFAVWGQDESDSATSDSDVV